MQHGFLRGLWHLLQMDDGDLLSRPAAGDRDRDRSGDRSSSAAGADVPDFPVVQVSRRFIQTFLMIWGLTSVLMLRSVPAFVMQGTPAEGTFGMGDAGQIYDRPFTNFEKGAILGAWGWGYTMTQMPGGTLTQRIGGKRTWAIFFTLSAVTSALIPTAGLLGGVALITVFNFASGMGQGPLFPGMSGLQGQWIPNREFSRASSIVGCMWSGGQAIREGVHAIAHAARCIGTMSTY
eukprot:SAG22_NODE_775_length_7293_cov_2.039199_3_plen_235_part_00